MKEGTEERGQTRGIYFSVYVGSGKNEKKSVRVGGGVGEWVKRWVRPPCLGFG